MTSYYYGVNVTADILKRLKTPEILIDIFSGRKNPKFNVSQEFLVAIVDQLKEILETDTLDSPDNSYLGYRGFAVYLPGDGSFYVPAVLKNELSFDARLTFLAMHQQVLEQAHIECKNFPDPAKVMKNLNELLLGKGDDPCPKCGCLLNTLWSGVKCSSKSCDYRYCS